MTVHIEVFNCPECNTKLAKGNKTKQDKFELTLMPNTQFDEIHQTLTCPDCQKSFDIKTQLPPLQLSLRV
jgi:uncharacterized protein YbaR (Trm112 family)